VVSSAEGANQSDLLAAVVVVNADVDPDPLLLPPQLQPEKEISHT
jgi:hypothetical protein